jgi:Uma2 family endonuclease
MFRSPGLTHQRIFGQLLMHLGEPVRQQHLGMLIGGCGVVLSAETLIVPDILYIGRARSAIIEDEYINGAPDLIVEIISPSSARIDQGARRDLYAKHGVQHYWLVHPIEEWIRAFELGADGTYELVAEGNAKATFSAPPFPDLAINLAELWDPFPGE